MIAATIAVMGALISAWVVWRAARLADTRDRERDRLSRHQREVFFANLLANDLREIGKRARRIEGTVRVLAGANKQLSKEASEQCQLSLPEEARHWEFLGLLPLALQTDVLAFQRLLAQSNSYLAEGHGFAADEYKSEVLRILSSISTISSNLCGSLIAHAKEVPSAARA